MKKTLIIYTTALIVVVLLIFILFKTRSPFGKANSSFASEPKKEITKIEMSDGLQKLTLEKSGEVWFTGGKGETRKSGILFILKVLQEIKIKSPVSNELFKSEILDKGVKPIRVKVYEKRKIIRSFIVYKTRSNIYGNIMKIREGTKPFIVYVPGYDGDIGSAFTLNELFWQPYSVFNLLPSEIKSVRFENFADSSNNFYLSITDRHYVLSDGRNNLTGWDSARVKRYLSYFTRVPFESWALDIDRDKQKAIEFSQPLYRITVTPVKGKVIVLSLWERIIQAGNSEIKDSDRLTGKTDDRDELFIIRYFDIDPIIKKRSYFYPE
jgi:hypothetical protein